MQVALSITAPVRRMRHPPGARVAA